MSKKSTVVECSERFYAWEIVILVRKAALSIITAHAGKTSVRCGLMSMSVLFVAFGAQMAAQPFCHDDANVAEFLSIATTCMILLIGLGYQSINLQGDDGNINDLSKICALQPGNADCTLLWWMNVAVYAIVGFTILVSSTIVYGALPPWLIH